VAPALTSSSPCAAPHARGISAPDDAPAPARRGLTAVPDASDTPAEPVQDGAATGFQPKRQDWRYLHALQEIVAESGRISDYAIATKLKVSHTAVWKWRQRPGFEGWVTRQLKQFFGFLSEQIRLKVGHQALSGRIEQQRLWFELQGAIKSNQLFANPCVLAPANLPPIVIQIEGDPTVTVQDSGASHGTSTNRAPELRAVHRTNGGNGHAAITDRHQEDGRG
jgi:hypothetical protein